MQQLLLVSAGSAFGGALRWLFGSWVARTFNPALPWSTIAINALGSFLIVVVTRQTNDEHLRLLLATGVLGGFTTYSTFNAETIALGQRGAWGLAAANVSLTVLSCLAAGALALLVPARTV